jgi:hypothetical protein
MSDPQPPHAPPTPQRNQRTPPWVVALIASVGLFLSAFVADQVFALGLFGSRSSASGAAERRELQRIAVQQSWSALFVCPSQELHRCELRYGTTQGRDLLFHGVAIHSVPRCDDQELGANARCEDAGVGAGAPDRGRCLQQWGVFQTLEAPRSDIRDDHLPPGQFRMECDEGGYSASFADPRF